MTFKRHALVVGITAKRVRPVDVYYDTPKLRLARNGLALRLRRSGDRWLQTLKAGGRVVAGLHERGEWELLLPSPDLDLDFLAGTPFEKLPPTSDRNSSLPSPSRSCGPRGW